MNKGQQLGLGMNLIGLALFVVWLFVRTRIPDILSIGLAVVFLGLVGASLFVLIRSLRQDNQGNSK